MTSSKLSLDEDIRLIRVGVKYPSVGIEKSLKAMKQAVTHTQLSLSYSAFNQ
jgi:hypothetical protein